MTTEATTVSARRPLYRDYFPTILGIIGVIILAIWLIWYRGWQQILAWNPVLLWFAMLGLLSLSLVIIGIIGNQQWLGALINSRFKMSLARLQIAMWTLLVLSAYITIAIHRLSGNLAAMDEAALAACKTKLGKETFTVEECGGGAINITFPPELVVAMGISAASFAGTSIIQSNKKSKEVNIVSKDERIDAANQKVREAQAALKTAEDELLPARQKKEAAEAEALGAAGTPDEPLKTATKTAAENLFNEAAMKYDAAKTALTTAEEELEKALKDKQEAETEAEGLLHKNSKPSDARFADIFKGDEIGNFQLIDMSKVQMFFLTVVVVVVYGAAVATSLHNAEVMKNAMAYNFPPFSDTLNSLMAISHGTYLSVKTVDHTKTAS